MITLTIRFPEPFALINSRKLERRLVRLSRHGWLVMTPDHGQVTLRKSSAQSFTLKGLSHQRGL